MADKEATSKTDWAGARAYFYVLVCAAILIAVGCWMFTSAKHALKFESNLNFMLDTASAAFAFVMGGVLFLLFVTSVIERFLISRPARQFMTTEPIFDVNKFSDFVQPSGTRKLSLYSEGLSTLFKLSRMSSTKARMLKNGEHFYGTLSFEYRRVVDEPSDGVEKITSINRSEMEAIQYELLRKFVSHSKSLHPVELKLVRERIKSTPTRHLIYQYTIELRVI